MKRLGKWFSLSFVLMAAIALGAGCAGAADKDKKSKTDEAIRWEAPSAAAVDSNAPAVRSAAGAGGYGTADDDLQSIWEEMDRMHRSMFGAMNSGGWGLSGSGLRSPHLVSFGLSGAEMNSDVAETDREYVITCELPGVPKESIQVDIDGSVLIVRAIRDAGTDRSGDENGQRYHYRERSYGTTERRFRVGSGVDPKSIKAQLKDGVLTIRVPKSEEKRTASRIPIQ